MVIDNSLVEKTLGVAVANGGDFAELFAEDVERSSVNLDDGRIENLASSRDRGVGIRVLNGESIGFAHTADISEAGLAAAARAASDAARTNGSGPSSVSVNASSSAPGAVTIRP